MDMLPMEQNPLLGTSHTKSDGPTCVCHSQKMNLAMAVVWLTVYDLLTKQWHPL